MNPQPQTYMPGTRTRPLLRSLLPALFLLFLVGQYLFCPAGAPPLLSTPVLFPASATSLPETGSLSPIDWLLYAQRPPAFVPRLPERPVRPGPEKPLVRPRARVAIIIDDLGFVQEPTEAFWDLEIPLTFAVLPWGRYSEVHAGEALKRQQEVILHLPLEPIDPQTDPGPGALRSTLSPEQLRQQLRDNLDAVPGIIGVNNHMGSKGTQDPLIMGEVMSELKNRGLFFIDSMTIHTSLAGAVARETGVPVGLRDVFLDGSGLEAIPARIDQLIEKALAQGSAIGIAHTRPGVAAALAEAIPRFRAAGIELVHVSDLVK